MSTIWTEKKAQSGKATGLKGKFIMLVSRYPVSFMLLLFLILPFIVPYKSLATQILIWGLFALGFNMLLGYTGILSFGHAAYFGLGAYGAGITLAKLGVSFWVGLLVGVTVSSLGALIIGYMCLKRRGVYQSMLTLAFAQMLYFIAFQLIDFTGGDNGLRGIPVSVLNFPSFLGGISIKLDSPVKFYYFALVFVMFGIITTRRILESPFGSVLQAIRENEDRTKASGYNTRRVKLLSFVFSGFFAGLAGALNALYLTFVPLESLYWTTSGEVVIMALLGGMGTFFGPFVGAGIFLILADTISNFTQSWGLFVGSLFILCVLFMTKGVWGTLIQTDYLQQFIRRHNGVKP